MSISVLIPALSLENLRNCIKFLILNSENVVQILVHINHIKKEDFEKFKLEIKNTFSDKTEIDMQFFFSEQNLGISFPLNMLSIKAIGEYIVYLNDDEYVLDKWDVELEKEIQNNKSENLMLTMRRIEHPDRNKNNEYYSGLSKSFELSDGSVDEEKLIIDADIYRDISEKYDTIRKSVVPFCIKRKIYNELGGYDNDFYPGAGTDPDFGYRFIKKYGIDNLILVNRSLVYHHSYRRATDNIRTIVLIKPSIDELKLFYIKHGISMQEFDEMLTNYKKENMSIHDIINISFKVFNIVQHKDEITWLAENVKKINPKNILEIGTERGGSMFVWDKISLPGKRISVDTCDSYTEEFRTNAFNKVGRLNNITFIKENSHSKEAYNKVVKKLGGEKVDFLFIDGDHKYDGVKKDFEMYSPLVRDGGFIGFHDIIESDENKRTNTLVYKFWQELPAEKRMEKIVGGKNIFGVGLYEK